jgi:hypothetical protein
MMKNVVGVQAGVRLAVVFSFYFLYFSFLG